MLWLKGHLHIETNWCHHHHINCYFIQILDWFILDKDTHVSTYCCWKRNHIAPVNHIHKLIEKFLASPPGSVLWGSPTGGQRCPQSRRVHNNNTSSWFVRLNIHLICFVVLAYSVLRSRAAWVSFLWEFKLWKLNAHPGALWNCVWFSRVLPFRFSVSTEDIYNHAK